MTKRWIIKWNAGYGQSAEIVEADSHDDAQDMAYELWREEAEGSSDYSAGPYSKEEAIALYLEDDDEE